ncbi:GNAT family N-acetyltransferase [Ornithinibacillus sp. FSL M8-0202]|uniref:GNAT family N-acetyltransferase n=1 Tax=Ornithinibacillus sp. FSL M8-0202 TaxID=2921616 RepID=UPI0030D5C0A4
MIVIETERLYLRELVNDDLESLELVLSDPESMQYYPEPFNRKQVEGWIQWNIENYKKYSHGLWAVVLKEGNQFIGDCGITMQNIDEERLPEIGFHIIKDFWNKGYATEVARACMEYAFTTLNSPAIYSYTTIDNIPSQKVAEKIGMKKYKEFDKNGVKQLAQVAYNPSV